MKLIIESSDLKNSFDIIRRQLYPDQPIGNIMIESDIRTRVEALLKVYLDLEDFYVDQSELSETDYLEECFAQFEEFLLSKIMVMLSKAKLKNIKTTSLAGTIVIEVC